MKRTLFGILVLCSLFNVCGFAQRWDWWPVQISDTLPQGDSLYFHLGLSAVASTGEYAPFWLQSNQHGDVSASPFSGNVSVGIIKPASQPHRWFDYDFGVQLTERFQRPVTNTSIPILQSTSTAYFNLLYAHVRLYVVDITAGVKPIIYETQDSLLTMGAMIFSGNSQPLSHITIGIDQYVPFPGCYGYFELKGGLTHAWLADNVYIRDAYIHHKFGAVRFGGRLPVNISYEFHHAAQWGGVSPVYGVLGSGLKSFMNVFLAHAGGVMANDQLNAEGNHVGSQQLALTAKGKGWEVTAYWQNFFEDNFAFLGLGKNITDGLWGISLKQTRWRWIEGATYQFLNTTSQSGPWHDRDGLCYAGSDGYYRNSVFRNGWNYFYRSLGTPFITSPLYNADGTIYTLNSRVQAHYIGLRGDIYGFKYRIMGSYVQNYGNDCRNHYVLSDNTAILIEISKQVPQAWGLDFSLRLAADFGTQFGNNFGALLSIRKKGLITKW